MIMIKGKIQQIVHNTQASIAGSSSGIVITSKGIVWADSKLVISNLAYVVLFGSIGKIGIGVLISES
jgi:hypothetical protein